MPQLPERAAQRRSLRDRLLARAYDLLSRLRLNPALTDPIAVTAADDVHEIIIRAGPAGRCRSQREHFPGLHFSPLESAIWHALADGPLAGKAVARAISQPYAPTLRTILHNLIVRRVLVRTPSGYERARGETKRNKG